MVVDVEVERIVVKLRSRLGGHSSALPGLVGHTGELLLRRPRSHPASQLGGQVRRENRPLEQVSDEHDRGDGQRGRGQPARRALVGPHLDDVSSFGIGAAEQVGEDRHLHAQCQSVIDRILMLGALEDRQPRDHVAVMEDAEPGPTNALKMKAQQKPTTSPTISRVSGLLLPAGHPNRALNRRPSGAPITAGNTK